MRSRVVLVLVALLLSCGAARALRGQEPAPAPATQGAPLTVPHGDGAPVITDGVFTPGEWDDALRIAVSDGVTLYLKEYRGVVFIGVRGPIENAIGPSELSLAVPGGPIQKLHASFALYEVALPPSGPEPKPRLGLTSGWYANEIRRDEEESERLSKQGKPPFAAIYPSEGLEFVVRRSKLPGRVWLMRLWASAFVAGKPGVVIHPPAAAERATDGWLELRLN